MSIFPNYEKLIVQLAEEIICTTYSNDGRIQKQIC